MRQRITEGLERLGFEPDELAYLALTSKPEFQVRDRLAWRLHQVLDGGLLVAREWRRCDLAILEGDKPIALIEFKATHTSDVGWGAAAGVGPRAAFALKHGATTYFEALIRADVRKARARDPDAAVYVIVILTHVSDPVPRALASVVKYAGQLRLVADLQLAEKKVDSYLNQLGETSRVPLGTGTAFGLRCGLDAWVCGPTR